MERTRASIKSGLDPKNSTGQKEKSPRKSSIKKEESQPRSLLDVLNMQKSDYVRNASVEELAAYVSEPNLKVSHLDATVGDYFSTNYLPGVVN